MWTQQTWLSPRSCGLLGTPVNGGGGRTIPKVGYLKWDQTIGTLRSCCNLFCCGHHSSPSLQNQCLLSRPLGPPSPHFPKRNKTLSQMFFIVVTDWKFALKHGKECTLWRHCYRKEGVWPHAGRARDPTQEVRGPRVPLPPLFWAALCPGSDHPTSLSRFNSLC